MKKSLITTLIAAPVLSLSSMAFAAEPMLLTADQMDGVTAGQISYSFNNTAVVWQGNVSPVTVVQYSLANGGNRSGNNEAYIFSGNAVYIYQN